MPFTDTGTPVAYEQFGDGPDDVLLVSGLLGTGEEWDAQVPILVAAGHRVTVVAPRGRGRNAASGAAFGLEELVADVLAVREEAEIGACHHLLGAGLGGVVAQHVALAEPERLRSLTLVGSWGETDRQLRALLSAWIWAAERASEIDELLAVVAATAYGPRLWNDGTVDDAIAATTRATHPQAFAALRDAFVATARAGLAHRATEALSNLEVPALLLVGALDAVAPERHSRLLAAALAHAELEVLGATGHAVLQSRPDAVGALLLRFLRGAGRTAVPA